MFNIRRMTLDDIDQIVELENLCFTVPWSRRSFEQELTSNNLAIYFTAVKDNEVVGYGGLWKILDEGHITNIAVHPNYRRQGLGNLLLQKIITTSIKKSIRFLTLEVRESNIIAHKLYKKNGFKIVGKRKEYYSDNKEDALIMILTINERE